MSYMHRRGESLRLPVARLRRTAWYRWWRNIAVLKEPVDEPLELGHLPLVLRICQVIGISARQSEGPGYHQMASR
ncbi:MULTISPECIES: hypothetical protein [unclassified Halomonas]|uniref:hypothetical protein n=1 Tax=Halomonas sp. N3-2A TaxID=2014541 RepID=UPI002FCBA2E7